MFARFAFWRDNPPLQRLVHALAIWSGAVKPPDAKVKQQDQMAALRAMFPSGKI